LAAGYAAWYFLEWRKIEPKQIAGPVLEHIGKPAARSMVTTAGKKFVTNAIRENHARRDRAPNPRVAEPEVA
jgi:hypothetical protein